MVKLEYQIPAASEIEILKVLWKKKAASVREIYDEISKDKETVYTTTLKTMQRMLLKGFITRDLIGRTHIYRTHIMDDFIKNQLIIEIKVKLFKNSSLKLALYVLGDKQHDEKLKKIIHLLRQLDESEST